MNTNYRFEETKIDGLCVVDPFYSHDPRGSVRKTLEKYIFQEHDIRFDPVEEMETKSRSGAIRGLHFQMNHPQAKLVRCVSGLLLSVAVDLRRGSQTFGESYSILLSSENRKMLYIPRGFAHGCRALTDTTFCYLSDNRYYPEYDSGIIWNDKTLSIDWMLNEIETVIVSEKDSMLQTFEQFHNIYGGLTLGVSS